MKINIFKNYIIIIIAFIISVFVSNYNLNNYDKTVYLDNKTSYHKMIKTDPLRYLGHGAEIKKDLENNISFFKSGRENYTKYLPPRIAAAYYFFFDRDLYNNFDEKIINENIHFEYLLIQNIIYFLAVVFLLKTASVILSKEVCFWLTIFLCFEPTLLQYHGTFWSESIFFSIQIIIIALLFKKIIAL